MAFSCQVSNFWVSIPAICKQVTTFATKVTNPAVGVFTFVILSGITFLQTSASLLFLSKVTAIVLTPDSVAF